MSSQQNNRSTSNQEHANNSTSPRQTNLPRDQHQLTSLNNDNTNTPAANLGWSEQQNNVSASDQQHANYHASTSHWPAANLGWSPQQNNNLSASNLQYANYHASPHQWNLLLIEDQLTHLNVNNNVPEGNLPIWSPIGLGLPRYFSLSSLRHQFPHAELLGYRWKRFIVTLPCEIEGIGPGKVEIKRYYPTC